MNNSISLNVFEGKNAIKDFLNPDKSPFAPLVELPLQCNPFGVYNVRIFAKLMNMLPLANVKSLPAYNMLLEAESSGKLKGVHSLIENSSGNAVFSIAAMASLFGIKNTKAIVSHEVGWEKVQLMRLFGTRIIVNQEPICPDPNDKEGGIYKARKWGNKRGWLNLGQYDNEANPRCHEKWTAPQIWKQTGGKITVFCAGLGTTGTIVGAGRYFKRKGKNIATVGVVRLPDNPVPGVRTPDLLREIAFDWRSATDYIEEVGTKESFEESLKLCRTGLMVGPSSGFALRGLLNFFAKQRDGGKLDELRNDSGEVVAVFICPDGPLPYVNEYFEYLDDSCFPPVKNEELLIDNFQGKGRKGKIGLSIKDYSFELEPGDACARIYPLKTKELSQGEKAGAEAKPRKGVKIIDLRSRMEFENFHLPGSKYADFVEIAKPDAATVRQLLKHRIFIVCATGRRARIAADILRKKKVSAYSIKGGMAKWSQLNLPMLRPKACKI